MSSETRRYAAATSTLRGFAAGLMLGLVAEQTVLFAVPRIIYERTGSLTYSGIAYAIEWVPALIAYPFAGLLADRLGGRRLFRTANAIRMIVLSIVAMVCWLTPSLTVGALMVNGAGLSLMIAPIRTSVEKTVPTLTDGSALSKLQSLVQNVELLAMALGPAFAAGLAHWLGKLPLLLVAAIGFTLAAWCWRGLPSSAGATGHGHLGRDLALGWRLFIANRPVVLLAAVNFAINFSFAIAFSANAYLITGVFHASDAVFGAMNMGAGVLGLLNLLLVARLIGSWNIYRLGACGFAAMCLGLAGMAIAPSAWSYLAAFFAAMAGAAWYNVFNRTLRVRAIDRDHLGKVIGPFYLINQLSYPIAGAISATAGPLLGVQHILLFMSALLALPGGWVLWVTSRFFAERVDAQARVNATPV